MATRNGVSGDGDRLTSLPATWECDLADDTLCWSAGVFELFGLDPSAAPDRAVAVAMYSPESRRELERLRAHAIATCGSFTFEAWITRPDGVRRWMRVSADTVVRDGRATHLYGTKQDITDEHDERASGPATRE